MSRVPGTYRNRGNTLYVLPSVPDDAPADVKNALAIRNACATERRCPACGTTPELTVDSNGFAWLTFQHEPDCPVLLDPEVPA